MFWRHLPEAQNACSVNPRDGCAKAVAAGGELAERAKNQTDNGVGVGSVLRAIFQEFRLDYAPRSLRLFGFISKYYLWLLFEE